MRSGQNTELQQLSLFLNCPLFLGGYPGGDRGIEPQLTAKSPCKRP